MEFSASVGFIHKESVTMHGHTIENSMSYEYILQKKEITLHWKWLTEFHDSCILNVESQNICLWCQFYDYKE